MAFGVDFCRLRHLYRRGGRIESLAVLFSSPAGESLEGVNRLGRQYLMSLRPTVIPMLPTRRPIV